jgi:bacillithiol biosynthesis cysteine-adding enzyme BshC
MPTIKDISFRSIPKQSDLFLSYMDLSQNALRFYRHAPTVEDLLRAAHGEYADLEFPRREIATILRRQNENFGNDSESLQNISELEKTDCFAIVTGQQVGLFTGPLYTIYKALTAIHIAEELKRRGVRAVPIFWMDTEDHDIAEVTHCTTMDSDSSVRTIDYRNSLFEETPKPNCTVGSIRLPEEIRQVTADYAAHLTDSAWKLQLCSHLEAAYAPGSTFAQAFARLISKILQGSGLILFDPHNTDSKRLASRVFYRAIREADGIHQALVRRNRELESAGFHSQASVLENSSVLFFFAEGERCPLERHNSGFKLKNGDHILSAVELSICAQQTPERFSPNVLLRPLVQDHLFPTLAYVGGPSEVAYFAQAEVLYTLYKRPMPVIWPRNSYTLIESEVGAEMDRLGLDIEDCFLGKQRMIEKAIRHLNSLKSVARLDKLENHLLQVLTEVQPEIKAVEPPLEQALETARRKIMHNIQQLRSRIIRLEGMPQSTSPGAIDLLMNNCFPNRNMQERELGIPHFLSRHGSSLIHLIHSATKIDNFAHRVLRF